MFYSLEEAAAKLGKTPEQVKALVSDGKLQAYRDGDKLRFKREQVDLMAANGGSGGIPLAGDSGELSLGDTGELSLGGSSGGTDALGLTDSGGTAISLADSQGTASIPVADSGDTDTIDLEKKPGGKAPIDPRQATGISVFDADEVDHADPMAQTVVTSAQQEDEDLALESVGSGSGLLDLTRESDDTSLGAELLDEIYPGGGEGSDTKLETAAGSSGVFDGAVTLETGSATGLEMAAAQQTPTEGAAAGAAATLIAGGAAVEVEPYDPAGSGLSSGMLLGACSVLVVAMIMTASAIVGVPNTITNYLSQSDGTLLTYTGIAAAVCFVFGLVGFFLGKAMGK
jgi:excisionase family DNA binding protein